MGPSGRSIEFSPLKGKTKERKDVVFIYSYQLSHPAIIDILRQD